MNEKSKNDEEQIQKKNFRAFQKDLEARYCYHKSKVDKQVVIFKWVSFILGLLIPILSAFLTFSINAEHCIPKEFSAFAALALTILTIVNSTLKPEEKFSNLALLGIELNDWKLELDARIDPFKGIDEEKRAFLEIIIEMNKKLSQIGEKMAKNWGPKPAKQQP